MAKLVVDGPNEVRVPSGKEWFVVKIMPSRTDIFIDECKAHKVEVYNPVVIELRRVTHVRNQVEIKTQAYPGYVFVETESFSKSQQGMTFAQSDFYQLLRICGHVTPPVRLPQDEIDRMRGEERSWNDRSRPITNAAVVVFLPGDVVRIDGGLFQGKEAVVVKAHTQAGGHVCVICDEERRGRHMKIPSFLLKKM